MVKDYNIIVLDVLYDNKVQTTNIKFIILFYALL